MTPALPLRARLLSRLPRRARPAPPPRAIGAYAHRSWPRRHRRLLFTGFTLFAIFYGFAIALLGQVLLVQLAAPLVMLAGLALWIAPDTGWAPEALLVRLVGVYLVALLCWPDYLALALPGMPWITMLRLTGPPLALTLLLCVSFSAGFRARLLDIFAAERWIVRLFVLFMGIATFSVVLSKEPFSSLNRLIVAQLNWTVPFVAAVIVFARPGRVVRFTGILWATALFNSVIAIWESHYHKLPWAGHIPSFLKIEDETVLRTLAGNYRAFTDVYRATAKFGVPLGLGEFLALATPFLLHLMATTRDMKVRVGIALSLPAIFYAVLQSGSRLGFICFMAALLLYGIAATYLWWRRRPGGIVPAALLFGYPVGLLAFVALSFVWRRLEVLIWGGGNAASSTDARREMYHMGIPMVIRNPLGHGIGQGGATLNWRTPEGLLTIDTYYLAVALEYGVIGFIAYYGMFAYAAGRTAWLGTRTEDTELQYMVPVSIALADFIISKSVFSQQENHPLVFVILGMAVALSWRYGAARRPAVAVRVAPPATRSARMAIGWGACR